MGYEAEASPTAEEALRGADLVVTSMNLDYLIEPFLDALWLKESAFAANTDACNPWPPEGMEAFGTVPVDDLEQEAESRKPMLPMNRITGELTGLVSGDLSERNLRAPAVFAFRGIALGDYAAAVLAVQRAEASGIGRRVMA